MATVQNRPLYKSHIDTPSSHYFALIARKPVSPNWESRVMSRAPPPSRQPSTRPLHFVNTDADSIGSRASGKRTRDVKSHLSGHYRRWKKQQSLSAQTTQSQRPRQPLPLQTPSNQPPQAVEPVSGSEVSSIKLNDAEQSISTSSPHRPAKVLIKAESSESSTPTRSVRLNPTIIPSYTLLNYGNSDPFGSLPLPVDPRTNMHMKLFHEGTTVTCWSPIIYERLQSLVHHKALMHGMLAVSKMIAATYLPSRPDAEILLPESRQHYGELLKSMRAYLQGQIQIPKAFALEMVHAATIFSFLAREFDAFELHLKSFKSLIDNMGGVTGINRHHGSQYLNAERIRGLFLRKKPLVPLESWAPGKWSEQEKFRPFDQMHQGSRALMSRSNQPVVPEGPFGETCIQLILDHRDMLVGGSVAAALYFTKQPGHELITPWLNFRSHALTIRTAEVLADIEIANEAHPSLINSLHACACLATSFSAHLIYFSSNTTVGLSYVPFPTLTQHLRQVARYIEQGARLEHDDLYLWALFIGACAELASRTWSCDPSFRGSSWCSTQLAFQIEKLGFNNLTDLKANLGLYIFPFMFESYLKVLFEKRYELIKLSTETAKQ